MSVWYRFAPDGSIMFEQDQSLYIQFEPGTRLTFKQKAVLAWTVVRWIFARKNPIPPLAAR